MTLTPVGQALAGAWAWFVAGFQDHATTGEDEPSYRWSLLWFRWGLTGAYVAIAVLVRPGQQLEWAIGTIAYLVAYHLGHTIHTAVHTRRGRPILWFWEATPFADIAAVSLIMASVPSVIFPVWAALLLVIFGASLSRRGSYLFLLTATCIAGYAAVVGSHLLQGRQVSWSDVAVVGILLVSGGWFSHTRAQFERSLFSLLQAHSLSDPLTGLMNRRALSQWPCRDDSALPVGEMLAVLVIDLDDFKRFNDRYGHAEGDARLCQVADVFRQNLRKEDIAYRYGGDEFVVLAPVRSEEEAIALAQRLQRETLREASTHLSVGYTVCPLRECDLSERLKAADRALMEAKRRSKGCIVSADQVGAALSTA